LGCNVRERSPEATSTYVTILRAFRSNEPAYNPTVTTSINGRFCGEINVGRSRITNDTMRSSLELRVFTSPACNCRRPNRTFSPTTPGNRAMRRSLPKEWSPCRRVMKIVISVLPVLAIISPSVSTSSLISSASTRSASHRSASLFPSIRIPAVDLICLNYGLLKCANRTQVALQRRENGFPYKYDATFEFRAQLLG